MTNIETIVYDPGLPAEPHPCGNDTIPTKKCALVVFLLSNELPISSLQGDTPPVSGPVQKWVLDTLSTVLINAAHVACGKAATLDNCSLPRFCPNQDSSLPAINQKYEILFYLEIILVCASTCPAYQTVDACWCNSTLHW